MVYGMGLFVVAVHGMPGLVYGIGSECRAVHENGVLVYGMGEKYDAVHGNGVLVYGVRGVNCATADKCVSRMFFCGKIFLTSLAC